MAGKAKLIHLDGLDIDPVAMGSQGNAVLGIRGSGKTYTATYFAECLHDAGIPFVAFDPIGVWRFLQVPGVGKGYPVVVAGGVDGDLPLTVASAPEIVRAAMASGVSLVVDLFDINLSKDDWKCIVMACVRVLLHENSRHGLRHVFIEEAAEFAPQRVGPDQGQVYAEIEKLARMGGNARLGYTLINQRAEEVNKAVLELCDNLFLHRQKGRNSLTALSKWLDIGNADNAKEIVASMATLPTGQLWAWLGDAARPVLCTVPVKDSLHPDRTVMRGDTAIKAKAAVDVGNFVATMKTGLAKFVEEAAANDPALLRRRIAELEKARPAPAAPDPKVLESEYRRGIVDGEVRGKSAGIALGLARASSALAALRVPDIAKEDQPDCDAGRETVGTRPAPKDDAFGLPAVDREKHIAQQQKVNRQLSRTVAAVTSGLSGPQLKVVRALSMWKALGKDMPTKAMVANVSGYATGGSTLRNILSELRTAGAIDYPSAGTLKLLTEAIAMTAAEGREMFLGNLSGPQRKIVDMLVHTDQMSKNDLGAATGYEPSGSTLRNLLSELRTLGVIDYPAKAAVAMEPWVFDLL